MKTTEYHIDMGIKSGYHILDIITFLIKHQLFKFEIFKKFYIKYIYVKPTKYMHVRFPLFKLTDRNITYYNCTRCGWRQFRQQTCNKCGGIGVKYEQRK